MAKIIPYEIFKKHSRGQRTCDEAPKTGFIQKIIELIANSMDFCRIQSDECDDYYDD